MLEYPSDGQFCHKSILCKKISIYNAKDVFVFVKVKIKMFTSSGWIDMTLTFES